MKTEASLLPGAEGQRVAQANSENFFSAVSSLMHSPFSALGLFVDNIISETEKNLHINLMHVKKVPDPLTADSIQQTQTLGDILLQEITPDIVNNYELYFQIHDDTDGVPFQQFAQLIPKFDVKKYVQFDVAKTPQNKGQKEL